MRTLLLALAVLATNAGLANPPTPPSSGMNLKSIAPGLYVDQDDENKFQWFDQGDHECDGTQKQCSITFVSIFSKRGIPTGDERYIFDEHDTMIRDQGLSYNGGKLGALTSNNISLDCEYKTYELEDTRTGEHVWKPQATLPALAPVFRYVCAHRAAS
jgi:hypothetical protein